MIPFAHVWKVLCATILDLCFPKEVTLYIDPLIRLIFTLYHLPCIALTLAITHSALERIVWVLIVPVAQDMEMQPYDSSHLTTFIFGIYNIIHSILPFSTLGVAVAILGHKVLNCFVETMVDAHSSHQGKDYPLLAARLRFIMEDREKYYTFLVVLVVLVSIVLSVLHTNVFLALPEREIWVVTSTWSIIFIQFCFAVRSGICHPLLPPEPFAWKRILGLGDGKFAKFFYGIWWESYIHYMRYIAIEMVSLIACVSLFFHGPLYVLSSSIEILIYLNIPHVVGHAVMSVSISIINIQRSLHWLNRHRDAILLVLLLALPYQLFLLQAMYFFRHHWVTVTLFVGVNVLLFTRAIDLVREFDVTEAGSVQWKSTNEDNLIPPHLSIVLEDAYEANLSEVAVVSLDMLIDIKAMTLYTDGVEMRLERKQVIEYGNAHAFLRTGSFYAYALPRLLSVQGPGYFGGKYFSRVRSIIRTITLFCLFLFAVLVVGLLFQAAFPQLRPWPVQVYASQNKSVLTVDHILVHMHLLSKQADTNSDLPHTFPATEPAFEAFKWDNISALDKDLYPALCAKSFYGIPIWEISLLALASYLFNNEEVNEMLQFMSLHMGSDWVIRERHGTDCISLDSATEPTRWDGYFDFYSAKNDLSVISVRGTDMTSFKDLLSDVNVFFDVVLYHLLSNIVPGAAILPSELIADLLRVASVPATRRKLETWESLILSRNTSLRLCENNNYRRDFFVDIYNHINFVGSRANPPKHVLLTGHSVGGAVASIIGSQMGIPAVGFGAPGISLSRKRFDIDLQDIHTYVTTVTSSHDIFSTIGGTGGEEHHVKCLAKTRELCHALEFLVGTLWRSCGSVRSRYPLIQSVI